MREEFIIDQLNRNKKIFKNLLKNVPKEMYMWKPEENTWSLLEIVCHLYDEERDDFRSRVKYVLELPDKPLKPISSAEWVKERKYIEQDYNEMLAKFIHERKQSIKWLKNLNEPKWNNVYNHPRLGEVTAKMFLTNWLAHDYLHFRQIIRTKYNYLKTLTSENLSYAGGW